MLNLRARLTYRADFMLQVLFGVLWQASTLTFAGLLLTRFRSGLGSFPSDGVLLVIGIRLLSHGFYVLIFNNLDDLPRLVDEGRMDGFFVRPLPVLTQLVLSQFRVNSFGDLAVGISTLGYALATIHVSWTYGKILFLIAAFVSGVLVEAAVQLTVACLALRTPAAKVLSTWITELMGTFGNYPLSILSRQVAALFTFVLPLAFIAYFPAEVILGVAPRHGVMSVLVHASPAAGFILFFMARRCWSWSLRAYRTAGG
jgi:ABC-2 type transport system permease protein